MNRENDHRDGWNVMGALTFCGQDEKGPFRVGVFGYTRKCVGDYLDWDLTVRVSTPLRRRTYRHSIKSCV